MKKITKKQFRAMHESGELRLICGSVKKTKEDVLKKIMTVRNNIDEYTRPVSNYSNLESDKAGKTICNIFISDCEDFVFVEETHDYSKDKDCSWDYTETFTTAYLSC